MEKYRRSIFDPVRCEKVNGQTENGTIPQARPAVVARQKNLPAWRPLDAREYLNMYVGAGRRYDHG
jgi:hypothetical protein